MPDEKLITVMTFNEHFEAHLAKNLLAREGIESTVAGVLTSGALFGNPGLGDQIVLQVLEKDAQRATGLLAEVAAAKLDDNWEDEAEADVWTCSICGEAISNLLSICHSCQTPREGIRAGSPRGPDTIQRPPSTSPTSENVRKPSDIIIPEREKF